ncbi:MAG TPA: laccase domain-containing protein [Chthoniobacterales bacterium]
MIEPKVALFPSLTGVPGLRHGFIERVPGLDVAAERQTALNRLSQVHERLLAERGATPWWRAEQVHGSGVAAISVSSPPCTPQADGLMTRAPGVTLGVHVADCCAVYLVDPVKRAVGLLHSGRKGTEGAIAARAVRLFCENFGSQPGDLIAQLSPCIRPPYYEVDFAAVIRNQLADAGLRHIHDGMENTGADLQRYYSYRVERGRTGRMLAFLGLT